MPSGERVPIWVSAKEAFALRTAALMVLKAARGRESIQQGLGLDLANPDHRELLELLKEAAEEIGDVSYAVLCEECQKRFVGNRPGSGLCDACYMRDYRMRQKAKQEVEKIGKWIRATHGQELYEKWMARASEHRYEHLVREREFEKLVEEYYDGLA